MIENNLKNYLLGNLPKTTAEEISMKIISGDISDEELFLAEDNLMEAFLDKELSAVEIKLFHENFLISKERRRDLDTLFLLKTYARNTVQKKTANKAQLSEADNFFHRLKKYFGLHLRPIFAIVVLTIFVLAGGLFFYNSENRQLAELNKADFSNLSEFQNLSTISLMPGAFRDRGETGTLFAEKLTNQILLQLVLPVNVNFEDSFDVKIIKEQKAISQIYQVRVYKNQSASELRILLPSTMLTKGDYKIEIAPEHANNMLITYPFSVR